MLTLDMIRSADRLRGEGRFHKTPLHFPSSLNARIPGNSRVHLKLELFQRTGSFKVRGATAKLFHLSDEERGRGILAASAGNHAQGVALAAAAMGARARIVMPVYSPLTKQEATKGYGAEVILHGTTFDEAAAHAQELQEADGSTLVHAFDDEWVMAGQGTIGFELLDDLPDITAVIVPVGGGGLISGIAVAVKSLRPEVKVIGVQAEGADSAVRSWREGKRIAVDHMRTIADGIKVAQVGAHTLEVIREHVDEMVTVTDVEICRAVLMLDEHAHVSAEAAGATPVAALLSGKLKLPGGPAAAVISGGNIDTFEKTRYIRRALAEEHRHVRLRVILTDRRGSKPREMAKIFGVLAEHEANVLDLTYQRDRPGVPLGRVLVELLLETRGRAHAAAIEQGLGKAGLPVER